MNIEISKSNKSMNFLLFDLLPESVLDTIYVYEHQLRHCDVMRELLMHTINCMF